MKNSASAASWPKRKPKRSSNELLLEPQFGEARRRDRLDVADRDQAVEVLAPHSGSTMNLKSVAEEAQALPSGELAEVDGGERFELALIQAAATDAAGHVAEGFAGVDQPVGDSVPGEPSAAARRIAVVRHAGRDRHGRNAIDNIRLRHRRPGHRDRREDGNIQPQLTHWKWNPYCYCNSIAS